MDFIEEIRQNKLSIYFIFVKRSVSFLKKILATHIVNCTLISFKKHFLRKNSEGNKEFYYMYLSFQ